jgi:spore coat polysaccharide biosynthesis predicted glycosyltransferase SpsG
MDATPNIGVGHAIRCLALAEELETLGFDSIFVGKTSSIGWLEDQIDSIPRTLRLTSEDLFEIKDACDILVIDSYHVDPNSKFIKNLPWKTKSAIVDSSTPNYLVDVYIHPGKIDGWQLPPSCKNKTVLEGISYVPIRRAVRSINHSIRSNIDKKVLTVVGGGTDPTKFIESIIPALQSLNLDFEARIFTSNTTLVSDDPRIRFFSPEDKIERHFSESDIVLTTAGISAWDVASMGIPMGIAKAVENQKSNFEFFTSQGLAIGIGHHDSHKWYFSIENLTTLLTSEAVLKSIAREQISLSLKSGASRIVHQLIDKIFSQVNTSPKN